jgi:hypothetical protein
MSDRTDQAIHNLTYEVITMAVDQFKFYQRLHQVAPNLVSASDVQVAEPRLNRLRSLLKGLQKPTKQA